jgi:hypothetical protein
MSEPVPLAEQLDELESEWDRRNRAYPIMVAKGLMRPHVADLKQERLTAAIRTLVWVERHQHMLKEYMAYCTTMMMEPPEDGEPAEQEAVVANLQDLKAAE